MDPKQLALATSALLLIGQTLTAQGLLVHDASTAGVLDLVEHRTQLDVEDQIAVVHDLQLFSNTTSDTLTVRYAYPLDATASATHIRWAFSDSVWHDASMVATPQDTVLPGTGGNGGSVASSLAQYLGDTPLYFTLPVPVPPGEQVYVELTFMQLLPYANARVEFLQASDAGGLLTGTLHRRLEVRIRSQRDLMGTDILGLGSWSPFASGVYLTADSAGFTVDDAAAPMSAPFAVGYDLDPLAYGVVALSNYLPDSLVKCDQMHNGFFVLLIEPEPTSDIVAKDLVIVIDNSGSMGGTKIVDAKAAATFMVQNLNLGDQFNVIKFNSAATEWSSGLQPFNANTMNDALSWISAVTAGGGTNINSSITMGIQDFTSAQPGSARMIVFLTDGQDEEPNSVILNNALTLRNAIVPDLQIFTFGIGTGFNQQLLNQLAVQNNGVSQFLDAGNFLQVMNDFYTQIQNPVMLNPVATFSQPDVSGTYPVPLQGLFVGHQMVIVGRYDTPGPVDLHIDGISNGQPVVFDQTFDLTGAFDEEKLFIPKIWAQFAVQDLMNEYYGYPAGDPMTELLEDSVVSFSMCYGVGSPFTSFADPGTGGNTVEIEEALPTTGASLHVFPEPSNVDQPVTFDLTAFAPGSKLMLRIYDATGREVMVLDVSGQAGLTWVWDGRDATGALIKGVLLFTLDHGESILTGRMTRM